MSHSPFPYAAGICTLLICLLSTATPCSGWWMEIHAGGGGLATISPAELLITDPLGSRTGYDPSTRTIVRDLPEGVEGYGRESLANDVTGEAGPESVQLSLASPEGGLYRLTVTGVRQGDFWLEFRLDDTSGEFAYKKFTGHIDQGKTYRYRIEYSQDNATKTVIMPDTYRFLGFSSPLSADDPRSFKLGETIPVKFRVRLKVGGIAADVTARLEVQKDATSVQERDSPEASEPGRDKEGQTFSYDRQSDQYVCNLNTRRLSAGRWRLLASLDDGSTYETTVDLK